MAITPLFFGEVQNGKLKVHDREQMEQWIQSLDGKKVNVIIERLKRKRTTGQPHEEGNQNGYYRGTVLPIAAEYMGDTPDGAHESLLLRFAPRVPVEVMGVTVLKMLRTGDMDTVQMARFIDDIIIELAKSSVIVPPAQKVRVN